MEKYIYLITEKFIINFDDSYYFNVFLFLFFAFTSYFFEDERGLFPEVQFVCDLKLPHDFQPINSDGEVSEFYCWPMDKVSCIAEFTYLLPIMLGGT